MYLHAGHQKSIREKDIIGIFDMDNATVSQITRRYLTAADHKGLVDGVPGEIPKSFILYREGGEQKLFFSPLSAAALLGRVEKIERK